MRTVVKRSQVQRQLNPDERGLAPPREPIPGAITYEQAPWYAAGANSWWLWNPLNRAGKVAVVMACVRLIAHQVSTLPAAVMRGRERLEDQPGWLRNPAPSVYGWFGAAMEAACVSLLMRGNAYLVATAFGSNSYPLGWMVANPDTITIQRTDSGRLQYKWGQNLLDETQVAHIKWLEVPGSEYGISALEGAYLNLLSADAMATYAADLATSGAMPFGLLSTEQRLAKGQATELRDQFHQTGTTRKGLLVLDSGLTYSQLQLSPKDMLLLEAQEWNARALCSVYGVPPSLVNIPSSDGLTYSTVRMQQEALLSFCLDPVLAKFEGVISYTFLPGHQALLFNRDRFTLASASERMNTHATAIAAGIYTAEEARRFEGMPAAGSEPAPDQPTDKVE